VKFLIVPNSTDSACRGPRRRGPDAPPDGQVESAHRADASPL